MPRPAHDASSLAGTPSVTAAAARGCRRDVPSCQPGNFETWPLRNQPTPRLPRPTGRTPTPPVAVNAPVRPSTTPLSPSSPRSATPKTTSSRASPPAPVSARRRSTAGGPRRPTSCWRHSSTWASGPCRPPARRRTPSRTPVTAADLKVVLRATVDELRDPGVRWPPTAPWPRRASSTNSSAGKFVTRLLEPSLQLHADRLRAAQEAGHVRPDIDPRIGLELFVSRSPSAGCSTPGPSPTPTPTRSSRLRASTGVAPR